MIDAFRDKRRFSSYLRLWRKLSSSKLLLPRPPVLCTACPANIFAALFHKPVLSYFHCFPMTPESHSSSSPFYPTAGLLHLPLFWPTFKGLLCCSKTRHFVNRIILPPCSFFFFFTMKPLSTRGNEKMWSSEMTKIFLCSFLTLTLTLLPMYNK